MPVCPKCHVLISEEHYERHLRRCGLHHKHEEPVPLVGTSGGAMGATPYARNVVPPAAYPWWKYGLLAWPPRRLTRRQKVLLVLYYILSAGGAISFVAILLRVFGIAL